MKSNKVIAIIAGLSYILVVFWLKCLAPQHGWAAFDAQQYHVPIINLFIREGIVTLSPPGIAMFPGMHIVAAGIARILGITELTYDGWGAFAIQSVWGVPFVFGICALYLSIVRNGTGDWTVLLPLFSSNYPVASWLWPTTDIATYFCFVGLLLILRSDKLGTYFSVSLYSLLSVTAAVVRQNYTLLSMGLLIETFLRRRDSLSLAVAAIPIALNAVFVAYLLLQWGNILPPGFEQHGSASNISVVPSVHVVALTGLLAWPFAFHVFHQLRDSRRLLAAIIVFALVASLLCCLFVPLDYNVQAGRSGSLVWWLTSQMTSWGIRYTFLMVILSVGFAVWGGVLVVSWREQSIAPELTLFFLFMASFLFQSLSWERYVEPVFLIVLTAFYGQRASLRGYARFAFVAWFLLYGLSSAGKILLGLGTAG